MPELLDRELREVIARRHQDLISGRDPGVSAEQALADMRRAIEEERARRP